MFGRVLGLAFVSLLPISFPGCLFGLRRFKPILVRGR